LNSDDLHNSSIVQRQVGRFAGPSHFGVRQSKKPSVTGSDWGFSGQSLRSAFEPEFLALAQSRRSAVDPGRGTGFEIPGAIER
jgi:hypothetical protein